MLWMNEYLMVVYEIEKARLARQACRKEEPSPTGIPPSGPKNGTTRSPNGEVRSATAKGGISDRGGRWIRAFREKT